MGAADPIIPEDGEGPAREMTLTYDYFFDKYEVSNAEFYRFAYETGYFTEAEKNLEIHFAFIYLYQKKLLKR